MLKQKNTTQAAQRNNSFIVRSKNNAHRFYYFVNGKLRSLLTHEEDFLSDTSSLFNQLNALFATKLSSFSKVALSASMAAFMMLSPVVQALPAGGTSEAGSVGFSTSGNTMTISSNASRSVARYTSFNIAANETVRFMLSGSGAAILNRVTSSGSQFRSQIFGAMTTPNGGQVFLVNPNGILFGPQASVNVGSLVASTLPISNNDFLSGNLYTFTKAGNSEADIENRGTIKVANGGYLAFVGSAVKNSGTITADGSSNNRINKIAFAVGDEVTLEIDNGILVNVTIDNDLNDNVNGYNDAILNSGNLKARYVQLIADLESNVYSRAINNSGIIEANAVGGANGSIELVANSNSNNADVINSGTLSTDGNVTITTDAEISNSGYIGAGNAVTLSADGDISNSDTINATGDVSLSSEAHIDLDGDIISSGNVSVSAFGDIDMGNNGDVYTTGGTIALIADANANGSGDLTIDGEVLSHGGNVTLQGDQLSMEDGDVDAGSGEVTLQASRSSRDIEVDDSNTNAGDAFDISTEELDNITASQVNIGSTSKRSDIEFQDDVSIAGKYDLNLVGQQVDLEDVTLTLGSQELTIDASEDALLGNIAGSGGSLAIDSDDDIRVNGNISGMSSVALDADDELTTTGTISAGSIDFDAGNYIELGANVTATGNADINSGGDIRSLGTLAAGSLNLVSGGSIYSNSPIVIDVDTLTVVAAGDAEFINLGAVELTGSSTVGGLFDLSASGTITVSGSASASIVNFEATGSGNDVVNDGSVSGAIVDLIAADDVFNNGSGSVSGSIVTLDAGDNITNSGSVSGSIVTLDAEDNITNSGSASGDVLTFNAGDNITNSGTASGDIVDFNADNNITNSGSASGDVLTFNAGDNITNSGTASGDIVDFNADNNITNSGTASGDIVDFNAGNDIANTGTGSISGSLILLTAGDDIDNDGTISGDTAILDAGDNIVGSGLASATTLNLVADGYIAENHGFFELFGTGTFNVNAGTLTVNAGGSANISETNSVTVGASSVGGNFNLDATDSITVAGNVSAGSSVNFDAGEDITNNAVVSAFLAVDLDADDDLTNNGSVSALGVSLSAGDELTNNGSVSGFSVSLDSGDNITNNSTGSISGFTVSLDAEDDITNRGSISGLSVTLDAGEDITNTGSGSISGANISLDSGEDIVNDGSISGGDVSLVADEDIDNDGTISGDDITVDSGEDITNNGLIDADDEAKLTAFWNIRGTGRVNGFDVNLTAENGSISRSSIFGIPFGSFEVDARNLTVNADDNAYIREVDNVRLGNSNVGDNFTLDAGGDIHIRGDVNVGDNLTFTADGDITSQWWTDVSAGDSLTYVAGDDIDNEGDVEAGDNVTFVASDNISNDGNVWADDNVTFVAGNDINNSNDVGAWEAVTFVASDDVRNSGDIWARREVTLVAGDDIVNTFSGDVESSTRGVTVVAGDDILNWGEVYADDSIFFAAADNIFNPGHLEAGDDATLIAGGWIYNAGSSIISDDDINLIAGGNITNDGLIDAGDDVNATAANNITNNGIINADDNGIFNAIAGSIINPGDIFAGSNANFTAGNEIVVDGLVDAGSGVNMLAFSNIYGTGFVSGPTMVLNSTTGNIGTPTFSPVFGLHIDADTLEANALGGSIYLTDADSINILASNAGSDFKLRANGDINVQDIVTAGNLIHMRVMNAGKININANMTAANRIDLRGFSLEGISGNGILTSDLVSIVTNFGNVDINTNANSLFVQTMGNVNIDELNSVDVLNSFANNFALQTQNNGNINILSGLNVTNRADLIANGSGEIQTPGTARITANTLNFQSGSGNVALRTSVNNLTGSTGGNVTIAESNGLNIGTAAGVGTVSGNNVLIGVQNGNLSIRGNIVANNQANLVTGNGNILDTNPSTSPAITARSARLVANGFIGTLGSPIDVNITNGRLAVAATKERLGDGTSAVLRGTANPDDNVFVIGFPPGAVIFNGQLVFDIGKTASDQGVGAYLKALTQDGSPSSDLISDATLENVQANITNLEDYIPQAFNLLMQELYSQQNQSEEGEESQQSEDYTSEPFNFLFQDEGTGTTEGDNAEESEDEQSEE